MRDKDHHLKNSVIHVHYHYVRGAVVFFKVQTSELFEFYGRDDCIVHSLFNCEVFI